ncbi:MAG: ribbon-helix-helix domain-containing protein [Candidatus Paceibacterota bacterium]|jgi:Arc/MetJ-type ribon-helix-helix transcriptional regulator
MRNIINISLPASMAEEIRDETKSGGFASVSEYIRHLIRSYKEDRLLRALERSELEFKQGKGKVLTSLKSLV